MATVIRDNYTLHIGEPTVYVDNEARRRSGHMTHALAEHKNRLINFNSNCSAVRFDGHSTYGWVEYRISEDGGETYSEVYELPYSKQCFLDGTYAISVEKAVACDDGTIVAICLRNCITSICQPWDTPTVITSRDFGKTWSEPIEMCSYRGRVYDACYHNGVIYAAEFCNDGEGDFCGEKNEHLYRIFASRDNGQSFEELCIVPVPTLGRGYCSMLIDDNGLMHFYAYNSKNEQNIDHVVSRDLGKTWSAHETCYLADGVRNPQTAQMDGIYIMHGRNAARTGLVLYTSEDGYSWDEGAYIASGKKAWCYYSNNIVLKDKNGDNRLLVQFSENYGVAECVNVKHAFVTIK